MPVITPVITRDVPPSATTAALSLILTLPPMASRNPDDSSGVSSAHLHRAAHPGLRPRVCGHLFARRDGREAGRKGLDRLLYVRGGNYPRGIHVRGKVDTTF